MAGVVSIGLLVWAVNGPLRPGRPTTRVRELTMPERARPEWEAPASVLEMPAHPVVPAGPTLTVFPLRPAAAEETPVPPPPFQPAGVSEPAPGPTVPDPVPPPVPTGSRPVKVGGVVRVSRLTGPGSVNDTEARWNVTGTDLGHMFLHRGTLYMVFGDTFGPAQSAWRSNVMAVVASPDPRDGLLFTEMYTADEGQDAGELLASQKIDGVEKTVIPTNGVSVAGRMFLHYMSVRHWGEAGEWDLNESGLAWSDDDGRTWVKDPAVRWPGDSNFGQVAFTLGADAGGAEAGYVYFYGIPAGRFGGVQLGRTPTTAMLDFGAYQYWDGHGWTSDRLAASTLVPGPVGELSVRWSEYHQRWLMLYFDEARGAVVLRTAPTPVGPWSEDRVITTAAEHPSLYAPYLVPGADTGPDVYFTLSQWEPYGVSLMRLRLDLE